MNGDIMINNKKVDKKKFNLSILFMGLSQLITKNYTKGIFFFLVEVLFLMKIPAIIAGIYGLITLGDKVQVRKGFKVIQGDNSIILLVNGAMTLLLVIAFLILYYINIRDGWFCLNNNKKELKFKDYIKYFYDKYFSQIILLPSYIGITIFIFLPVLVTFMVAFTNYSMPNHIPPKNLIDQVGIDNFLNILSFGLWKDTFIGLLIWNIIWAITSTFTIYVGGLLLALILSRKGQKFVKVFRTIFILPWAIPQFIALLSFKLMFNELGPINNLLKSLLNGETIKFFLDPTLAKIMLILINMWIGVPYFMMLLEGALLNIPSTLYEAADIDGASRYEQFTKITLPMLLAQTAPSLVMR